MGFLLRAGRVIRHCQMSGGWGQGMWFGIKVIRDWAGEFWQNHFRILAKTWLLRDMRAQGWGLVRLRGACIEFGHGENLSLSMHRTNEVVARRISYARGREEKTTSRIIIKVDVHKESKKSRHGHWFGSQHENCFIKMRLGNLNTCVVHLVPIWENNSPSSHPFLRIFTGEQHIC